VTGEGAMKRILENPKSDIRNGTPVTWGCKSRALSKPKKTANHRNAFPTRVRPVPWTRRGGRLVDFQPGGIAATISENP
jgi:hypothetical protein